ESPVSRNPPGPPEGPGRRRRRGRSRWIDGRTLYLNLACTGLDEAKELLKNRQPGQTVIADMRNGIGFLFQDLIAPLCPDVRWSFRQGTSLVPCPTHPEIPELKDMLPDIRLRSRTGKTFS
ncbi:hypothetical protein, partial [Alistipes ihumii]|uniref:hypothetical protein n=1 Tax=Alistipes ihumii TaxID=1470347 RepID=UPI0023563EDF